VVVDGSTDDTPTVLAGFDDPRLNIVHQTQQGSPAARNTGVGAASGAWLLVIDDDDRFPADFVTRLRTVAEREQADIVGAPWIDVGTDDLEAAVSRARSHPVRTFHLASHPRTFPAGTIETPFLSNTALIRRRVFDRVQYDPSFGGNAWREETSFFLSAVEAGFKVMCTDETYSYHLERYQGGQRRPRLSYELWLVRNNWRFLKRHGRWLQEHEGMGPLATTQLRFMAGRVGQVAGGRLRHRRRRLGSPLGSGRDPSGG
jgi:GT2 family glycosyltransferase